MARKSRRREGAEGTRKVSLPRKAIRQIDLGQLHAEHDLLLKKPGAFVETAAIKEASNHQSTRHFYVGRRGTGKTAITQWLEHAYKGTRLVIPEVLAPEESIFGSKELLYSHGKPFRTVVACFTRAICGEALLHWATVGGIDENRASELITSELRFARRNDYDTRLVRYFGEGLELAKEGSENAWLRFHKKSQQLENEVARLQPAVHDPLMLLFDRLDDCWDGRQTSAAFLIGFIHACVKLNSLCPCLRVKVFLRESAFAIARNLDNEFSKYEHSLVPLDWTPGQLIELVERRINLSQNPKLANDGTTWSYFFEESDSFSSRALALGVCQARPRDLLSLCTIAIDIARGRDSPTVEAPDLRQAASRFSESRVKAVSDEFADSLANLDQVFHRFHGLGIEYTLNGIGSVLRRLKLDPILTELCGSWLDDIVRPIEFARRLYEVGFIGVRSAKGVSDALASSAEANMPNVTYRGVALSDTVMPQITERTHFVVHPSFRSALELQDLILDHLDDEVELWNPGDVSEYPTGLSRKDYYQKLQDLQDTLKLIEPGTKDWSEYEDLIGEVLRGPFWSVFGNVKAQSTNADQTARRDWICSNRAESGFWKMIRDQYNAVSVTWECKNKTDLEAADFQQASYRMNAAHGRFVVMCYRGKPKSDRKKSMGQPAVESEHVIAHVRKIHADKQGLVLVLNDSDIHTFLRQAQSGKLDDDKHISDKFDSFIRLIA